MARAVDEADGEDGDVLEAVHPRDQHPLVVRPRHRGEILTRAAGQHMTWQC